MIKSIEKHPNIELDSVYIQSPDYSSVPSKNEFSESFVYLAISPKKQVNDLDSFNSYVDETLFRYFRPDSITYAQERQAKSHIPSSGFSRDDKLILPLLFLSKEYLLSADDNAVVKELYGLKYPLVRTLRTDKNSFVHRINYSLIVFPDSDIASEYFLTVSHKFKEPYIVPFESFQ
ncbi:hypothetical protein GQ472_05770 [archaeon]|nr:hypothetical protein [archaeon]